MHQYLKNEYIYSTNFKFINDQIISYKTDYYNNFEEYEIQMIIYRDNKDINYTIYINILFDNCNIKYYIKNIYCWCKYKRKNYVSRFI